MRETDWLESRGKKKYWYYSVTFAIVAGIAIFIFFNNNKDLFVAKSEKITYTVNEPHSTKPSSRPETAPATLRTPEHLNASARADQADSLLIDGISCKLNDREALTVLLSIELFFPAGALKKEILLKRDNLKVMVQKTILGKSMHELIVDSLRTQMKRAMNRILEKGTIIDVEFRNFSIDKVQRR
jgi:flagellar basal body-associated protein FliL